MADGYVMGRDEFEEEEVWGAVNEKGESSLKSRKSKDYSSGSGSGSAWRIPAGPRKIQRANSSSHGTKEVVQQSSAPMNIPDWSKIYGRKDSKKDGLRLDDGNDQGDFDGDDVNYWKCDDNDVDADDDDDEKMVPPHELIARRLARSQIASFSVCEGIGRTLKGRDLSRVRNAILTKTGFLE